MCSLLERLAKASLEYWVGFGLFAAVAGAAEDLKVAEVVGAAFGNGDDVVDFEGGGFATVAALMAIALENGVSYRGGEFDAGGLTQILPWGLFPPYLPSFLDLSQLLSAEIEPTD